MKTETCESLGVKFTVTNSPETVEEYNELAKRPNENACLEDAKDNVRYRGTYPKFRKAFLTAVIAETGIQRKTVTFTNRDGSTREDWDESEAKYFKKVCETKGVKPEAFQPIASTITIPFDPSVKEEAEKGPKKLPKKFAEAAATLVAGGHAEAMATKLSSILGKSVEATADELGWAIKEWDDAKNSPKKVADDLLAA